MAWFAFMISVATYPIQVAGPLSQPKTGASKDYMAPQDYPPVHEGSAAASA
jgi:hypothetical protein